MLVWAHAWKCCTVIQRSCQLCCGRKSHAPFALFTLLQPLQLKRKGNDPCHHTHRTHCHWGLLTLSFLKWHCAIQLAFNCVAIPELLQFGCLIWKNHDCTQPHCLWAQWGIPHPAETSHQIFFSLRWNLSFKMTVSESTCHPTSWQCVWNLILPNCRCDIPSCPTQVHWQICHTHAPAHATALRLESASFFQIVTPHHCGLLLGTLTWGHDALVWVRFCWIPLKNLKN